MAAIRGRLDASTRNDIKSWANFVSDDMVAPLESEMKSKEAWIRQHESYPTGVKYWYGPLEDVKIRFFADIAVVTFHSKQFTEIGGQTAFVHKWQTETHLRKGEKWLLIAVADCLIPTEPVAVKLDPKLYDALVGRYQWSPSIISTVTREGDNLIEEFPNLGKTQLLPENETTFFVKDDIYREMGATDRIVKKIK